MVHIGTGNSTNLLWRGDVSTKPFIDVFVDGIDDFLEVDTSAEDKVRKADPLTGIRW
jgi:hypothetical protein